MEKTEAKQEVARLVSKLTSLTKGEFKKYDEENTKKDFILPLFDALGWNTQERREVTAEDKVSRRRVDYAFRIDGIPKFFLEAKPLRADLDNPEYAWQAINYAWTKDVTWAVLTDFEGLKVFNAQWKGPSLLYNRFLDLRYMEYLERFDELWLLSRHSFEQALLDIEAEKVGKKAKREPVGKQLFDDLIAWRQRLYKQLWGWNKDEGYSEAQIDEAVQRVLDRLIFIRTAEDRELEERGLLPAVREWRENGRRKELDKALVHIFREFDNKYDSELFEEGHFCEDLACDSSTYAQVIEGLYGMRDEVPTYNFDAIDVDVLGGIYEQYLSYRQGLPEEVEEAKRARRKKRGIYYTPKFVVQYIVENTVGRLLQERSHDEIRKLRILDPACGSGSFLIEAFDRLDRYHQEARGTAQRSDEKAVQDDFLERLRIIKDNIYGVDLDPQAVEIARLNLLLKTLHQRALLPKLENNIRCGNSLISGLPIELSQYFGAEWEAKRPFNWEEESPKIMEEGGFDVVIGNPPYVRVDSLPTEDKVFYNEKFLSAVGKYDLYYLFLELALRLVREGGILAFITPNRFCTNTTGENLRKMLLAEGHSVEITSVSTLPVFEEAANYPVITIVRKNGRGKKLTLYLPREITGGIMPTTLSYELSQGDLGFLPRSIMPINVTQAQLEVALRISPRGIPAGKLVKIQEGLRIPAHCEQQGRPKSRQLPIIKQYQFSRYSVVQQGSFIAKEDLESLFPRKTSRIENSLKPKLVFAEDALRVEATLDKSKGLCQGGVYFATLLEDGPYDLRYILSLFNSSLLTFIFKSFYSGIHMGGGFLRFRTEYLEELPINEIDFDNPQDVKLHDRLVELVERMLDLHKRLKEAKGEEKKDLERQIARTDRQIDDLVYQLYNITEEERKIIEGET